MLRKIFFVLTFALTVNMVQAQEEKLPEGVTPEMAAQIKALLPKGVPLQMFFDNLPQGVSVEQAMKALAERQGKKIPEVQKTQEVQGAAQDEKLPEGVTPEIAAKIKALLPQGVTLKTFFDNLPQGMSVEQALKLMAEQAKAKQQEASNGKKGPKNAPNEDAGCVELIPYAGLNLGMTTSLGCPQETRSVSAAPYNFNFAVGVLATKRFNKSLGILTGLRVERKGSNSNVYMENYFTKVHFDGAEEETQGYFSGRSQGRHDVYALTMPLAFMYQPNQKWEIHLGPYFSWQFHRSRHGISSEGTIRQNIYSSLIPVDHSETDNSAKVSKWDWGASFGSTYQMWKQLYLVFDFSWGFVNQWDGRDYGMKKGIYNIYGQLGFGWKFYTKKKHKG